MEFNIKGQVPNTHTPDSFEVNIRVMHGDADSYDNITIGPFFRDKDEDALVSLITTLDRMDAEYPHGRGGGGQDNYDNVEGFVAWFDPEMDWEGEDRVFYERILAQSAGDCYDMAWPVDPYDYETHGDPDKVTVRYFDDKLTEYEVEVVK